MKIEDKEEKRHQQGSQEGDTPAIEKKKLNR